MQLTKEQEITFYESIVLAADLYHFYPVRQDNPQCSDDWHNTLDTFVELRSSLPIVSTDMYGRDRHYGWDITHPITQYGPEDVDIESYRKIVNDYYSAQVQ